MNPMQLILLMLKGSIFLVVLALGLKTSLPDATSLFRRPRQLRRSLLAMYMVMPLAAAVIVSVLGLHPAVKIALVGLSVSPVPPGLPRKQLQAGGKESYTLGLLVAISLLAIVLVPVAVELFEIRFKTLIYMAPAPVSYLVLTTVLGPLALGIALQNALPGAAERLAKPVALIGSGLLLVGVLPILVLALPGIVSLIGDGTIVVISGFTLLGLAAGHWSGGPDPRDRTVLALSSASRHPGIAIASTNFPNQKLVPAAILLYLLVGAAVRIAYLKSQRSTNVGEI